MVLPYLEQPQRGCISVTPDNPGMKWRSQSGEEWRSAEEAARDGLRRRKYLLSPPKGEANKCKSEANRVGGLCDRGPRQRLKHIYLRAQDNE